MPRNVTGRDGYVIAKALATAYALIGTLPKHCREESDRHDMARLLRALLGDRWEPEADLRRHVLSEAEWSQGWKWRPAPDDFADDTQDA